MHAYPVISISFGGRKENNYDDMLRAVRSVMMREYHNHRYLLDSDKFTQSEKEEINNILNGTADTYTLKESLFKLSMYLERYHDKKVIILIDEYDVPLQEAYTNNYYDDGRNFIKGFYSLALKGNENLEKGIITRSIKDS